ncbi:hypothetical protein C8R47DRAFT_1135351 [Mycena vitilis]|nr:hypothetical protein C8R47DRAFT_1135351 [Mycena vitilis]
MTVSPYIQRQLRVARRGAPSTNVAETSAQMDGEPTLELPSASTPVDLRSLKAKRRQGVSDLSISSLFSLVKPQVDDWRFAHVPRDSDSDSLSTGAGGEDEEGEVFEFPRPPTALGALSPPSRYLPLHSHSQNSSVDSARSPSSVGSRTPPSGGSDDSSHSGNWSPTSSGPPETPTTSGYPAQLQAHIQAQKNAQIQQPVIRRKSVTSRSPKRAAPIPTSSVSVPSSPVVARSPASLAPFSPSTSPLALSTPLPLSPTTFTFPSTPAASSFLAAPQAVVKAAQEQDDGACDEAVEADVQDEDDDDYYAAHARALIHYSSQASLCMPGASAASPPVRLQRESCVVRPAPSSSSLFSAARDAREDAPSTVNVGASVVTSTPSPSQVPMRPRRAPPPVPVSVEEDDPFFSSPSISTSRLRSSSASTYSTSSQSNAPPSPTTPTFSLLRNSHFHPTPPSHSHSPSHTRMLTRTRGYSASECASAFRFPLALPAIEGEEARASRSPSRERWSPASYRTGSPSPTAAARPRHPPRVPNFSRPTSSALLTITPTPPPSTALPTSPPRAISPLPSTAANVLSESGNGRGSAMWCVDHPDLAADYVAYAPLLRSPTPMGRGFDSIGSIHGEVSAHEESEDWVLYEDGEEDEERATACKELSPLVAPAPLSESSEDERLRPRALIDSPFTSPSSFPASPPAPLPFLSASPSPRPARRVPSDRALRSRWSASTLASVQSSSAHSNSTRGNGRTKPFGFTFGRRKADSANANAKPKPTPRAIQRGPPKPVPRPMGSVTVLRPPPKAKPQRAADSEEWAPRASTGSWASSAESGSGSYPPGASRQGHRSQGSYDSVTVGVDWRAVQAQASASPGASRQGHRSQGSYDSVTVGVDWRAVQAQASASPAASRQGHRSQGSYDSVTVGVDWRAAQAQALASTEGSL